MLADHVARRRACSWGATCGGWPAFQNWSTVYAWSPLAKQSPFGLCSLVTAAPTIFAWTPLDVRSSLIAGHEYLPDWRNILRTSCRHD